MQADRTVAAPDKRYHLGSLTLSSEERVIRRAGVAVPLAPRAVDVLLVLLANAGSVVDKRDLMESVWPESYVDEGNLTQTVYVLRAFLKEHASDACVENVRKRGYCLTLGDPPASRGPRRWPGGTLRWAGAFVAVASAVLLIAFANGPRPLDARAMGQYLLAKQYQERGSPQNLRRSYDLFAALARDYPHSALGFAGAAQTSASLAYYASSPAEAARLQGRAIVSANQAVTNDAHSADADAALGAVQMTIERDDVAAAASFARALQLNPNDVGALAWSGTILLNQGRIEKAHALFARAVAIAPNAAGTLSSLAWSDFLLRDYGDAVAFSRQMLAERQLVPLARITLANAYIARKEYRSARPFIAALLQNRSTRVQALSLAARVDALTGHRDAALGRLQTLEASIDPSTIGDWDAASIAAAYLALDDARDTFVWLTRVSPAERRAIARDPRFATLQRRARFASWMAD
jgi:Tfp pilus assembly protein PilF